MYLTNFTDDELERTLVQMPDYPAALKEAARRFVPGGREALAEVADLREKLNEADREETRLNQAINNLEEELAGEGWLRAEIARLTEANEMLNGVVEALTAATGGNEHVCEMLRWSYSKLHESAFGDVYDALMVDRIKLWLEHGIAG